MKKIFNNKLKELVLYKSYVPDMVSCLKSYHIKAQRVGNLKVQFKINHGLKKTSQGEN